MAKKSENKLENVRHSLSHLLAMAVLSEFPKAKLGIGPAIENGFYYDFDGIKINDADQQKIEKKVRELIKQNLNFKKEIISFVEAKKLFANQPYKLELIKELNKDKQKISIYKTLPINKSTNLQFTDLCAGPHVKSTKEINPDAFKLTKIAGAYWKGSEENPMLTRVYGVAFETKKELDEYLKLQEEAEKRDHRKLGPELDLFTFSELVGSGLPLWTPKGTLLRDLLDNYVWELRKQYGYDRVDIPHITKKDLYEKSGHWEKFKDELFKINTREGHLFAMKPMNCPHHTQIYARHSWSYRDLPQRYATTTKVYRDEQSGELSGLSRVRAITQDDAHVFCRKSQVKEEINNIWEIINEFYGAIGFSLDIRLSLRDPKQPKNYLGDSKLWNQAEDELRSLIKEHGKKAVEAKGEAAFYGPKIDFMAKDSLGREWQVATIQLDMNMPERFNLSFINEKSEAERPVMIHAAIMGSIERYLAILIEHFAGAFPLWLSPVQAVLLPISDKQSAYAKKIHEALISENIRVEIPDANETLGKRIRTAEMQKVPYILVVGDKEIEAESVAVRQRGKGDLGAMKLDKFIEKLKKEISDKTI